MKGFLPFFGRSSSPRFLFLPIFIFLFSVGSLQAKTVVIGAGFGNISVPNMNGLNPGDILAISPGTYTGGSFDNLKGITITNNGGPVIFSGGIGLNTLVECTISNLQFINFSGIAIRWNGNSRRCVEKNIYFKDVNGDCNNASEHNQYNGDTSTLKLYMCTFDSLTLFRSGMVMMASWGDAPSGICFMDSIVFSRVKIDSTLTNGTEVRGTFFRLDGHDWRVIYKGVNTVLGDVGIFYISGSGTFHHIYRNGGRGYIARLWNIFLKSQGQGASYFYDNVDLNSTVYGTIDVRIEPQYFTQYLTGGDMYVYNNTSGNKGDNINYWSSLAVVGQYDPPYVIHVRNNIGFNLTTRGHTTITMNQGDAWTGDSANNRYYDKPDGVVDPVTGVPVPGSPLIGKGQTIPWIKDDLYHTPRVGAYDIGAVQHGGAPIQGPPNQPPVAVAGPLQTITLPVSTATLDGSKSYDPDGTAISYAWTLSSGTGGTITTNTTSKTTVTGLTQGTYIYKLIVKDDSNATAFAYDTIIVKPAANLPPIANAGADQNITLPVNSVSVDGTASKDQDNGGLISTYAWSQVSGPSAATITSATAAKTTITGLKQGVYIFKLTVSDSNGATASDSLIVTVNAAVNLPPVANAGTSKTITLPTNSVNLDGSLSADPDGTITGYSWAQISGPSASTIVNGTMATATANNLVAGLYTFEITVTDNSGATSKAQVKITVVASGIQPPVANAGANQTITLPVNQVSIDGSGSVAPSGSIVSYSWVQSSGPSTANLSAANAAKSNATNLVAGTYIFYLTIKDNNNATASDSVIIIVKPLANIPPVADAGPSITITLPTNSATLDGSKSSDADGTIVSYSWTKTSGPNTPGSTGAATSSLSLTGLIAGQYIYQLLVKDNMGATSTALVKITVVAAPNILPVADAGPDQTITAPSSTVDLDGTGSNDPDGTIKTYSWTMVSGQGSIIINNGNTANPSVVGLIPGVYVFELLVTDNNGGTDKDDVTITVKPQPTQPNQLPIANAGTNLTITSPASSIDLNGSSSFDPDGTIISYSWKQVSGPTAATIANEGTKTPTVSSLVVGVYVFELTVIDNSGGTDRDQVTVTVNPHVNKVNEMPVANAGIDTTIQLPASTYVLNASASQDPDGSITNYQWTQISGPNTVTASTLNSSVVDISNLQEGAYEFQLTVTDNQGATSQAMVTITVSKGSGVADQVQIYPNPAHDIVNGRITSQVTGTMKITVYDMNGRMVIFDESQKSYDVMIKSLNISNLSNGMYTIQINIANRQMMVAKFIKQ